MSWASITEERIAEFLKKKLILRTEKADSIWLTLLGVYTKHGQF